MAKDQRQVDAITARDVDFTQWFTDVCKKAELIDYSSVKGMFIYRPYGYAASPRLRATRMWLCPCSFPRACCKRRRTTWRASPPSAPG